MYAIIKTGGKQYKVEEGSFIDVEKIDSEKGSSVSLDNVCFLKTDSDTKIGAPFIEGAKVEAKVVKQAKGDKIIVFKKKRRKGYRRTQGHRQDLTQLKIEKIIG